MSTYRQTGIASESLAIKLPCAAAAADEITLSGEQTVDGVALSSGDRVLVTSQSDAVDNGIYVVSTSAWQRTTDFDGASDAVRGTMVNVYAGTSNSGWYELLTSDPVIIGTSELTFQRWFLLSG